MAGEIQLIGGEWGLFGGEPMTDPNIISRPVFGSITFADIGL